MERAKGVEMSAGIINLGNLINNEHYMIIHCGFFLINIYIVVSNLITLFVLFGAYVLYFRQDIDCWYNEQTLCVLSWSGHHFFGMLKEKDSDNA